MRAHALLATGHEPVADVHRLLVEAVQDYAIFVLDPSGNVATWNAGAERIKGYASDEIVGRHFSTFYSEEDKAARKPERELELVIEHGRVEDEGWRVRKDGSRFWANVVITALYDDRGELTGFGKVTRDLTERRAAEETERELIAQQAARKAAEAAEAAEKRAARRAEESAKRAEEASRIKDEFLATVSHELRTPLNAIMGWAHVLRERNRDANLDKGIEVIHRNAQAQAKIIEDILDVSRIITGNLRLDLSLADFAVTIRNAIEVVSPSANAKQLTIDFAAQAAPCLLTADHERLQQVVWNLLSNAVKFTDPTGAIRLTLACDGRVASLTVEDSGRGIDPQFLPQVFDRFKQADSSTTRRVGGLGLGLAIVRHIVELHGGSVAAHSAGLGQGASFSIHLPIVAQTPTTDARESAPPDRSAPASASHGVLSGVRALVVDDETDTRELVHAVLVQAGATVATASSARAALQRLASFAPDVIVSDVGMPDEDGYSLLREVRKHERAELRDVPAIALTAYTRGADRSKALAAGFTTHLGKPLNVNELVDLVAKLARR